MTQSLGDVRAYGRTLRRYLCREIVFPAGFTLLGLSSLMLARQMLGFSDLIVNRGLGAATAARIAVLQLVPLLTEMLPLALLVGSLVALGRLAADHEAVALEACGLAPRRLGGPLATFGLGAALLGLVLSTVAAPASLRHLDATLETIARDRPGTAVRAREVTHLGHWRLEAREVSSSGDRLRGVVVEVPDLGETLFAESGTLEPLAGGATRAVLRDGAFVKVSHGEAWKVRFGEVSALLPADPGAAARPHARPLDARPMAELVGAIWSDQIGDTELAARRELLRRLASPSAAFVFGLLATPLFLVCGGRSRSAGGLLGILSLLVYYGLVQLGAGLDQAKLLPAGAGPWLPNLCLLLLALALQRWVADGSPIAPPETRPVRSRLIRAKELCAGLLRRARPAALPAGMPPRERVSRIVTHRWSLQRDVALTFLQLMILSFSVLFAAYLVLDVLERLRWFARFDATAQEAVRFYGLRIPLLVSRVVPMSLLVATALVVSLMGVRGELTAMRASGIAAPRGMLPVLVICAVVAPLSFLLNDRIVPRANVMNEVLKSSEIKADQRWHARDPDGEHHKAVWLLDGNRLVEAERLDPQLGIVQGLTIYDLDARGLPLARQDARAARHLGGGTWRLVDPQRFDLTDGAVSAKRGPAFAVLWEEVPLETDTRNLSVAALRREIAWLDEHRYDATALRVDLAQKLAAPFACLVLPAVVFLYALSGPPYPRPTEALVASVAVAIGSILLGDLCASLGYAGLVPPAVAGVAPTAAFGVLSAGLGLRLLARA